jgi:Trypsin
MRRNFLLSTIVAALVAASASPAGAITEGTLDGELHPNVAMILYQKATGRFRCSATLVSPTVLITAAHCTEGIIGSAIVTFATVAPPTGDAPDPATGYVPGVNIPAGYATGTPHTHPLWDGELQNNDLHDVGVIVLDSPVTDRTPAQLAPRGYLDTLSKKGLLKKGLFTTVGYGVFFDKPSEGPQKPVSVSDRTRRYAESPGQNVTSQVLKLAENGNDSRGTGGTCFGDSGGPAFRDGYLVADTSFGASQFCRSYGGFYRLDTDDARGFLDDFIAVP